MKRVLAILLAAMLMIAVIPSAAFAASKLYPGDVVRCSTSRDHRNIALRKGPGYNFAKNHVIKHGDKAVVLATGSNWVKVKLFRNGNEGWLRSHYVDGTCNALIHNVHMVTKKSWVYRHASHTSKKLGVILPGATVKVYKFSHSYAYCEGVNNPLEGGWMRIDAISTARVR